MTTINEIIRNIKNDVIFYFQSQAECECDCIMKKDRHYWLNNACKQEKLHVINFFVINMYNLIDALTDDNRNLRNDNNKLIAELQKFQTPPAYENDDDEVEGETILVKPISNH